MNSCKVAVIGAGLAGLYTAQALHASGVDLLLVEARDRVGGRILTAGNDGAPSADGFDLGPSWFWPAMQPAMADLVAELGLDSFLQHSTGDVVFERMSREEPQRFSPADENQQSMRVSGGTGAVVQALASRLPDSRIRLGTKVAAIALKDDAVELSLQGFDGSTELLRAEYVVAALPPRLLDATVVFSPAQDPVIAARWRNTSTWMAPHAKFFAIYDEAFWRKEGLSGTAQSMVGPMVEIHDATTNSGKAAVFGFLGVGADQRASVGDETLKQACVEQLARLFGPRALTPRATILKDWAADPFTATIADRTGGDHPVPGNPHWVTGTWEGRLIMAGSETSPAEPGYLAGAIVAAKQAVADILFRVELK
ncbi:MULTISPECIES: FAD-dependent oxidoreductase [unclassified Rhizobium]|jgi:monoamine oxidase|uniref:flavin monoamine oxidase family protein n=1 Tax=unclassified Rhizobium TaxID=2613769 RepID=UPI0006480DCB|nr:MULTISPECIES: FAD-dependent oxidoreductase [unclassified Rhizobium]MBN8954218.1 FAD-dependent oxidoreductase [Rhizobium tropici]OJY70891.1 MAG: amine oxidase [Rhizobium sp. 60-20]RKD50752.1 monoamine oxidase [Rhizobium sp. WW_1]